jgi:hypothetical protein
MRVRGSDVASQASGEMVGTKSHFVVVSGTTHTSHAITIPDRNILLV